MKKRLIAAGFLLVIVTFTGTYFALGSGLLPTRYTKPMLLEAEAIDIVIAQLNEDLPNTVSWANDSIYALIRYERAEIRASARYQSGKWMVTIQDASPDFKASLNPDKISSGWLKLYFLKKGTYVIDDKTGKVTGP